MSKCPKCGAKARKVVDEFRSFECASVIDDYGFKQTKFCVENQLAAANRENERLRAICPESQEEFFKKIVAGALIAAEVPPSTTVCIDEEGKAVELFTDNKVSYYGEWIKGEGADICIYRERQTEKVIGVRLLLRYENLIVGRIKKPAALAASEPAQPGAK
jgi:hypothetical protein